MFQGGTLVPDPAARDRSLEALKSRCGFWKGLGWALESAFSRAIVTSEGQVWALGTFTCPFPLRATTPEAVEARGRLLRSLRRRAVPTR